MLPWSALIGKLVELLLTKLVGRHVELSLDEKKQAAKAFLRFHDCLAALEYLTDDFLDAARPFLNGEAPRLYQARFTELAKTADAESAEFLAALKRLYRVVELYDPNLAYLLAGVRQIKQGLVVSSFASRMEFRIAPTTNSVFSVAYTKPNKQLLAADLEEVYNLVAQTAADLSAHGRFAVHPWDAWPKDFLLEAVANNSEAGIIEANRLDQVKDFCQLLEMSSPLLSQAREKLRTYMRERFTFEDLLYASKRTRLTQ